MKLSFARDAKLQILKQEIQSDCCMLAFLGGLLRATGEWDSQTQTMSIVTDIYDLHDFCNKIVTQLYGNAVTLTIEDDFKINKTRYYRITLPKESTYQMLSDFGMLNNGEFVFDQIDENLIREDCCKKAFVKGVFLGCGTSGIKLSESELVQTSTGYDIEFVSHSEEFFKNLARLLESFNMTPKIISRKKHYVLYVKESSQVCDLLAMVEAFDSVLQLQNELALRELRNKVNRQTNCMNANITKTVNASINQIDAIKKISNTIGLEYLPMDLQEVALLRLANPEESLSELLKISQTTLTKSALNNKLKKLLKIASLID